MKYKFFVHQVILRRLMTDDYVESEKKIRSESGLQHPTHHNISRLLLFSRYLAKRFSMSLVALAKEVMKCSITNGRARQVSDLFAHYRFNSSPLQDRLKTAT